MFRSLGTGFLAVIAVGYFSGVIRANYLGVFTTFLFDAAVLGLYLGFFFRKSLRAGRVEAGLARPLVLFLIAWPAFLCLVPINYFLIQCVALRAAIWFLPVLLIAARLTTADLAVLARGLVVLNLVALAVGVYIYLYGVQVLYPVERDHPDYLQLEGSGRDDQVPPGSFLVSQCSCLRRDHAVHPAVPPRPVGRGNSPPA